MSQTATQPRPEEPTRYGLTADHDTHTTDEGYEVLTVRGMVFGDDPSIHRWDLIHDTDAAVDPERKGPGGIGGYIGPPPGMEARTKYQHRHDRAGRVRIWRRIHRA